MATDPTTIPTIGDIQQAKKDMTDINTFVVSEQDAFTDNTGESRKTMEGLNTDIEQAILEMQKSRGFRVVGIFEDGFTYELFNDVGIDADGNSWIYVGAGAPNKVVTAGTVPSSPDYEQVTFSTAENVQMTSGESVQKFTTQSRQAIEALYKSQGYNNVFFFEDGFTYIESNDIGIYEDGTAWTYTDTGALPVTVAAGTVPSKSVFSFVDFSESVFVNAKFDGTDETQALQDAIDKAVTLGVKYVHVDGDIYAPGTLTNRSNVFFIGSGSISGQYRTNVHPAKTRDLDFNDINPSAHLQHFKSLRTANVVIMGDSLCTFSANALGRTVTLSSLLESKIKADNPEKSINFINRAIGGQTWATANDIPTNTSYDWYTDSNTPWLDYVEDASPDLIILSFGMNDAGGFSRNSMESVIAKINAFAKIPDIVFCTNMVPTLEPDPTYSTFGTKDSQEGRDYVAGFVRRYAIANDYGLIDINRYFNLVRDGFDVRSQYLETIENNLDISATGSYVSEVECRAFRFAATIPTSNIAGYFGGTDGTIGSRIGGNSADLVFIRKHTDGNFKLEFYNGAGNIYKAVFTNEPVPNTTFDIIIEFRDNTFLFRLSDGASEKDIVRVDNLINHGGLFQPRIGKHESGYTEGPFTSITYQAGYDELFAKHLTNDELWAVGVNNANTQEPFGGNGINHPTSIGACAVYLPAVMNANFRANAHKAITVRGDIANSDGYIGTSMPDGSEQGHTYVGNVGGNALKLLSNGQIVASLTTGAFLPVDATSLGNGGARWNLFASDTVNAALPTYADNASAISGGLSANRLYKTATGEVRIVY